MWGMSQDKLQCLCLWYWRNVSPSAQCGSSMCCFGLFCFVFFMDKNGAGRCTWSECLFSSFFFFLWWDLVTCIVSAELCFNVMLFVYADNSDDKLKKNKANQMYNRHFSTWSWGSAEVHCISVIFSTVKHRKTPIIASAGFFPLFLSVFRHIVNESKCVMAFSAIWKLVVCFHLTCITHHDTGLCTV